MTVRASGYDRVENDLYQTEPWATEALLRVFPVKGLSIWEPAAGNHMMADVLRDRGAEVFTSDIKVYDREHDQTIDFLFDAPLFFPKHQCDAIVTNPPFGPSNRDAVKFARLALQRCNGFVMLLLTAKFDSGKTRTDLFRDNRRFIGKVVLMDRIQWFPGPVGGTEDHAWFIWQPAALGGGMPPRLWYEGKKP